MGTGGSIDDDEIRPADNLHRLSLVGDGEGKLPPLRPTQSGAVRIAIDQYRPTSIAEIGGNMHGGGAFSHATLVTGNGNNFHLVFWVFGFLFFILAPGNRFSVKQVFCETGFL
jgi:hypothetical protein